MIRNYNLLSTGISSWLKKWNTGSVGSPPTNESMKKRTSVQWFASLLFLLIGVSNYAQTTLISSSGNGGFENGSTFAANSWTAVNSTTDSWIVGTVPGVASGTKCAYISSSPTGAQAWTYSQLSVIQHLYYDVTIPAGQPIVTLTFKWKATGEGTATNDWDNLKVFWGTVANVGTPVANTANSSTYQVSGAGAVSGMYKLSGGAYNSETISLSGVPGSTYRLVLSWKSDSSDIVNPPASVDDINLVSSPPSLFTAVKSGLWSSAATWGGAVPGAGNDVSIPSGLTVTVDQVTSYRDMTVDGTVQWNSTANTMTLAGNLTINSTGKFLAYTSGAAGLTVNVAGNMQNDGYANFALSSLTFNGSGSTLSGSGTFQGDGTNGIIRSLNFANTGSNAVTTSQNIATTFGLAHTAGSLNTNGKIILDNTAQVYGQPLNLQVASIAVTNMGSGYTASPIPSCSGASLWTSAASLSIGNVRTTASNIYLCTTAGTSGTSAPTHTSGTATATGGTAVFLWVGTAGTIGLPYISTALTIGNQYFYGGNLYTAVATTAPGLTVPTHTSGTVGSFRYVGSPATVTANWDSATSTLRSLNLTSAGSGYSAAPAMTIIANTAGTGAAATVVFFQQIAYTTNAFSTLQKSGGSATITGGLTINSDQGAGALAPTNEQASSGVGSVSASNGGVNYTVAPTVGFALPTALNLIQNPGSGYIATPTVTVTGGNLVSGTALATSNFTIAVNAGKVQAVYLNSSTTATYSTLPTLTLTASPGVNATLAFPAGCLPTATANIGSNGQLTSFTMTNAGYGYVAVPTVGVGTANATPNGGTFTTVASGFTARVGLYNLSLNNFSPSPTAVVQGEDAAIPANRKINNLALGNFSAGLNLSSSLVLYGSGPLTLTGSGNGSIINLGGNNLLCTWNGYGGTTSTFGATTAYIKNGSMTVIGRGGGSTFNFPFSGTFTWNAGSGTAPGAGSTVTRVTVSDTAAPTNTSIGTGLAIGNRAFRVQYADIGTNGFNVTPATGTAPAVTLNYNSQDALTGTQDQLFVADATALTGAWTVRSTSIGASGSLAGTGQKATAGVAPGPIVPTNNSYYAWATSAPTITDFSPLTVCASSGTFTITGTNLTGVTAVTIGGTAVTSFTVVSATQITGVAGNGADGVVAVTKGGNVIAGSQSIIVSPSAAAPSVSPLSTTINLGDAVNFTATGGAGTFNWYTTATGGSPIFTGANYTGNVCATSTLYVAENNGSCDGVRTAVPVTITPTVATASTPIFCGTGGDSTLTVTPSDAAITYTWSTNGSATLSPTTGESIVATVTATSNITVTATRGACSTTAVASVSVFPLPSATVTTSANGVCAGTSATINSGLSAGNFVSSSITPAALTAPVSAVTLVVNGVTPSGSPAPQTFPGNTFSALDDGGWGDIPMGFNFNFFGSTYNKINIGTNGTLQFGTFNANSGSTSPYGLSDFAFTTLPSTAEPFNMIAVLAMDNDLSNTTDGGTVKYWTEGIAPNRKFVVAYIAAKRYNTTTYSTSQAIFYETTGVVEVHVTSSTNTDANKLIGINNGTGTIGALAFASGTTANANNPISSPRSYRFTPPSNFTTTWTAHDLVTDVTTTLVDHTTNTFSLSVTPANTTTYTISYTNQTTGCTNALNSAQVTMSIISATAPSTTAVSNVPTVCLGGSANLSLTGNVNNIGNTDGLTYQWQFSLNGGSSWTDISGATSATTTVTPSAVTSYQCLVKACTGTPVASSPVSIGYTNLIDTTTGASRCGAGQVSLSATTLTAGASLKWYAAASGGTALFTGSPYVTNVTGTTTYYVAAETTGPACSSPRVAVTATVSAAPAFRLTDDTFGAPITSATICTGSTTAQYYDYDFNTNYTVFNVTPATGIAHNTLNDGASGYISFNPTTTTTYTIAASTASGVAGCLVSSTFTVTVNSANVTAATTAAEVCLENNAVTLSASSLGYVTGPQTAPTGYCAGGGGTNNADDQIFGVSFGSMSNLSQGESCTSNYSDYTSAVAAPSVTAGQVYPFSVVADECDGTTYYSNGLSIFIDYNRDGDFDDSGEQAYTTSATTIDPITRTGNITIPTTATAGLTRMRVVIIESVVSPGACDTYTYGETEDYNVNIIGVADATASYTYAWTSDPSGFSASGPSAPATPGVTTTYYVTATSPEGCTAQATKLVTVNTDPVATITGGASSVCLAGTAPDNDLLTPSTVDFDTTTEGVTWESSNTAVATIDANGVLTSLSAGTTVVRAFIHNPTTGCTTYAPNSITVNVYSPVKITGNPSDVSILAGENAAFTAAATGSNVAYRWQYSADGTSASFTDLADGGIYTTTGTASLTITAASATGYYRCKVTGSSPCTSPKYTTNAKLTVATIAITNPTDQSVCQNNDTDTTGTATFTVTTSGPAPEAVAWEVNTGSGFEFIESAGQVAGITFSGFDSTTLVITGLTTTNSGYNFRVSAAYTPPATEEVPSPETQVVTSNPALLTVNAKAVISGTPTTNTVCYSGATTSFAVNATGATTYQWQYFTGEGWDNVANGLPTGVSYGATDAATLNLTTTSALDANATHKYRVRLTSPGACQTVDSGDYFLQVNTPTYSATITSANTYFCSPSGTAVTLTAATTGTTGTSTYAWSSSPSGFTASTAVVNVTPSATTVYTVTGTDASGCSNTATVSVTSSPAVTATLTSTFDTICPDTPVTITASSLGLTEGPAGLPATYCVADSSGGGGSTPIANVTFGAINQTLVTSAPYYQIVPSTTAITTITAGQTYPLTVTSTGATIASVWIDYDRSGTFEASEWQQLWTSASSGTINIAVPSGAVPGEVAMRIRTRGTGNPNGDSDACSAFFSGTSADFSVNIIGSVEEIGLRNIVWTSSPADATLVGVSTLSITRSPSVTTTYTAAISSPIGCSTTVSKTVTTQSGATIGTQPVSTTVCQGATATFSVVASGASVSYQWSKNGVAITGNASAATPTLTLTGTTPADNGVYTVTVHPICGADAVSDGVATLLVNPTPTATSPGAQAFCAGTTTPIALTGTPSGVTFDISGGAAIGLANTTGVTAVPSFTGIAGTATISLTPKANGCTGTAVTFVITINPTPAAPTAGSNSPVCSGTGNTLNLTASTVSIPGYSMNGNSGVAFIDISTNGTAVDGTLGDDTEHNITIPSFTFNGIAYTTARVGVNGAIVFGSTTGEVTHINAAMPNTAHTAGNVYLAPFWDDLDIQQTLTIKTKTDSGKFIIQYTAAAHDAFTTGSITFQVQLELATGKVNFVYQDVIFGDAGFDSGVNATVGIQMSSTSAVQYSNSTASLTNGQSITFTPNVASYSWTGPNSFSSSLQNPSISNVTTAATGTYSVKATNVATGCQSAAATTSVTITPSTTTEYTVTACGTYHWSINGADYTASGNYTVVTGCHTDILHLTIACSSVVTVKMMIQGYYAGSGLMTPVKANELVGSSATDVDDVTVELRDATTYAVVAATTASLQTNGDAVATFPALSGTYYIAVKHRNTLETWSANPVSVTGTPTSYDFRTSASQAYGSNMVNLGSGVYGFYTGDINQDGNVDNLDYSAWEEQANDIDPSTYYRAGDLNGDGNVDNLDYSVWEATANGLFYSSTPEHP